MMNELVVNEVMKISVLPAADKIVARDSYRGMNLAERLKKSSLLGYYETAVHTKDKDWLTQILQLVEVDDASIELILCRSGVY